MKKNMWLIILLFFLSNYIFAQQTPQPWWLSLEQGKQHFRNANFGSALMLFEDARRDRRAMYEQMERDLILLLSVNEVRRIGDSLERIERYSLDRRYTAAYTALQELYYRVPKSSFNNSASSALSAFEKLKDYPEAEYWIGEVYRVEGELTLALMQYRKALLMRSSFEDPGFYNSIQYKIASILDTRQEYTEMIRVYNSIISDGDSLWESTSAMASFARTAMTRTLTEQGIDRFMEMYRYNNNTIEPAHRALGFYYAMRGRVSAEQHLMFAFLIQNTTIIEEIQRHQFDFVFTNLQALTLEINRNPLLQSYIDEVEYYRTAYYFAASLHRNGKTAPARTVWSFLAVTPQAGQWQTRSASQLINPRFEPVIVDASIVDPVIEM